MPALYGSDLAHIQATAYSGFSRAAAPGLLKLLRGGGVGRGARVVDLGCGDGSWLRALTRAGYDAVGADASPPLVKIARRNAPRAKVSCATVRDFMIPPCAAVTALGEVLAYGAPKLAPVLERIHAALRPGGILIFDVIMSGKAMNYRNWVEGKGWAMGLAVSEADGNLTRRIAIFRRHGKYWRRTDEHHVQRIFTRAEVMGALRRAGFAVRTLDAYGDQKMLPRRLAFFARKKA